MRKWICLGLVCASLASARAGKLPPLTVSDVSLMLRSGYSSDAVQKDVIARHFMGPIDAAAEQALAKAGAHPDFIAALKAGAYAVPAEEAAAVQAELATTAQRRVQQAEEARKFNTLYQDQLAQKRAAPAAPQFISNAIAPLVAGDLVVSRNGTLTSLLDVHFEKKKLIGLYFAAHWCPQCRKFTPRLVEYYNRIVATQPDFEILFVSYDRSAEAMQRHMRDAQMPWPAVTFDKVREKEALLKYSGPGVPCLVVVDATGKVVADSYAGKTYLGPSKVLEDLERLFAASGTAPVALQR